MAEPTIQHVSDTALWAAAFRARETERKDALFRDPYARRLAGARGEEIARATPFHERNAWSWVTRTVLFDRIITEQLAQGVDMVLNLAAGLDARPYRMQLPAALKWVEADFPAILDYKEGILAAEKPVCSLERVRVDLSSAEARRSLLERLGAQAGKVLVITEGLLIYLEEEQVAALAEDLRSLPAFQRWLLDIASPPLLKMLQKKTHHQFSEDATPLQFAPQNNVNFFAPHGWRALEVYSLLKEAARLKRTPFMLSLFARLPDNERSRSKRPWSGVCLLGKQ